MKNDILDRIIDRLYDYEDTEHYACDLAYELFEGENVDGTFTYSTYEAKQWIIKHFEEIGEVYEELKFQFGSDFLKDYNVFEEPEKFMVLIILESASYLLSRCKLIDDNWNGDKITLNKENIEVLRKQLEELKNDNGIYEN